MGLRLGFPWASNAALGTSQVWCCLAAGLSWLGMGECQCAERQCNLHVSVAMSGTVNHKVLLSSRTNLSLIADAAEGSEKGISEAEGSCQGEGRRQGCQHSRALCYG